jgi:hypothetical protein
MVNEDAVRSEARHIADDAREAHNLSDAEAECLRDLLKSDEAFGQLVSAQRAAVSVDADQHDIEKNTESLAREGAAPLGNAIDQIVELRISDAQAIVELSNDLPVPWGRTMQLYRGGFRTIEDLKNATQQDLIEDAGVGPSIAARVKANVGSTEEDDET